VSAHADFLSSLFKIFVYAMRAFCQPLMVKRSLTMFFFQKSKSSSPAGSHASSHRRSGSAGSTRVVAGLGSSSMGDYRLNPTLTDDQASHLS
jgi:hypothetical protein